jgi:predicted Zn-dependent peptidase
VLLGDPNRVNTDLAKLQAVTAADVQRVMRKYFTSANRLVIYYLPEAAKTNATSSTTEHRKQEQRSCAVPATLEQRGGQGR